MTRALLAAALALALAAPAARAQLSQEADLNAGLEVIAAADMIRRQCPEIEPRRARALGYMRSLALEALSRGYSRDAIRAYVEDDAAKAVVKGRARAYLEERGLGAGAPEDHCRVGRAEIAAGSPVGAFLQAR